MIECNNINNNIYTHIHTARVFRFINTKRAATKIYRNEVSKLDDKENDGDKERE